MASKCCNCSDEHPANFLNYPSYLRFIEKRSSNRAAENIMAKSIINPVLDTSIIRRNKFPFLN